MLPTRQLLRVIGTFAVAALFAIAASQCSGGLSTGNVTVHTGVAHAGIDQVTIQGDDGWYYSVPSDVMWTNGAGSVVEGSRPDCLPATGQTATVKFAATQVTVNGWTLRPVVWVYCQNTP